jgi:hypothetical protein
MKKNMCVRVDKPGQDDFATKIEVWRSYNFWQDFLSLPDSGYEARGLVNSYGYIIDKRLEFWIK